MTVLSAFLMVLAFPLAYGLILAVDAPRSPKVLAAAVYVVLATGLVYGVVNARPAPACYRPPGDVYQPFGR